MSKSGQDQPVTSLTYRYRPNPTLATHDPRLRFRSRVRVCVWAIVSAVTSVRKRRRAIRDSVVFK